MKKIELNPLGVFLCFIGFALLAAVFMAALAMLIVLVNNGMFSMEKLQDPNMLQEVLRQKNALLIIQSFSAIGMFLIPCLLVPSLFKGYGFNQSLGLNKPKLIGMLWSGTLIFFGVLMLTGILHEINQLVPAPDYWVEKEAQNLAMQKLLIQGEGLPALFAAIFVVAVLPGVLEELTFRGLGMHIIKRMFKNAHIAVILQAVLFSVVHFNVTQLLPIFGIGLLFGYLAHYSGSIWYGVLIHFLNNSFAVVSLFYEDKYEWAKKLASEEHLTLLSYTTGLAILVLGIFLFIKSVKTEPKTLNYE